MKIHYRMPGQKIRFKHTTIDWNKVLFKKKKKKKLLNTWTLKAQNWETYGHDSFNCLKILFYFTKTRASDDSLYAKKKN